jgi:predicted neuraminidase
MKIHARKEMIFDENKPTPACHASTVLPLPNGEVLAAWFGGTAEGRTMWIFGLPPAVTGCGNPP